MSSPSSVPALEGRRVGPVTVAARIGAGAMGVVFRAVHDEHGEVCVKVMNHGFEAHGEMLRRFRREAEAARRIVHPHVVRGFGLIEADGLQLLVQEWVPGGDLEGYVKRQGGRLFSTGEAVRLARETALGLGAAHAAGLVHRDLKPQNVLLASDERGVPRAKLADLGLVLQVDGEPLDGKTILTAKGQALGTPRFMAPEMWSGSHDVDHRVDLYALGVLLHWISSGRWPITADSIPGLIRAHELDPPVPLGQHLPDAPAALAAIVDELLAKDPVERPPNAGEVARRLGEIEAFLSDGTRTVTSVAPPPPSPATGTVGTPAPRDVAASTSSGGSSAATLAPGAVIDNKYEVIGVLGEGGMGVVYRVRHRLLARDFALKTIRPEIANLPELRARFTREAQILLDFAHAGAVNLREFGEHGGGLFLVMDFAEGETLTEHLERVGPLGQAGALALAASVLDCLEAAHTAGIVHRDLKPDNLIVTGADASLQARILDFGIARAVQDAAAEDERVSSTLTTAGAVLGTLQYMSPEQASGDPVDGKSDVYAVGVILYEATSGARPFDAETRRKLIFEIVTKPPAPLDAAVAAGRVGAPFAGAVLAALAKEPADRPDARGLLAMLRAGSVETDCGASAPAARPDAPASRVDVAPARTRREPPTAPREDAPAPRAKKKRPAKTRREEPAAPPPPTRPSRPRPQPEKPGVPVALIAAALIGFVCVLSILGTVGFFALRPTRVAGGPDIDPDDPQPIEPPPAIPPPTGAPLVTIELPADGTVARAGVPIRIRVEGEHDGELHFGISENGNGPIGKGWTSRPIPDGGVLESKQHRLPARDGRYRFVAFARAPNGSEHRTSVEVFADQTPPSVTLDQDDPVVIGGKSAATVSGSLSEPCRSVTIGGEAASLVGGSPSSRFIFDAERLPARRREIAHQVIAVDRAGNEARDVRVRFIDERVAPPPPTVRRGKLEDANGRVRLRYLFTAGDSVVHEVSQRVTATVSPPGAPPVVSVTRSTMRFRDEVTFVSPKGGSSTLERHIEAFRIASEGQTVTGPIDASWDSERDRPPPPLAIFGPTAGLFVGRSATIEVAPDGEIETVDVRRITAAVEAFVPQPAADDLVEAFFAGTLMEERSVSIGESFTVIEDATEAGVGDFESRYRYTLRSVETRGDERVAVFDLRGTMELEAEPPFEGFDHEDGSRVQGELHFSLDRGEIIALDASSDWRTAIVGDVGLTATIRMQVVTKHRRLSVEPAGSGGGK